MQLTEADLRFVVETVATRRRDYDHIISLIRDKDDLLEPMLEDPRLVDRLLGEQEAFVRVSPGLMFGVLLRRVRRDLEGRAFVLERDARGKPLPVFAAPEVAQLLGRPEVREYLTQMLCSFVRTNTALLYWKERGQWRKRKFCDINLDDMIALCQLVDPYFKPRLYKRIADIALFISGIYPDHATLFVRPARTLAASRRTLHDYEREGQQFYTLAARHPEPPWPTTVYETLAAKFSLARQALNTLSDNYLKTLRSRYFNEPAG